jgi:signal transduction histidine kinase
MGKDDNSEDDREKAILELREAVRARDDFIATAVHELRNPLTPIRLCVELIRTAAKSGDQERIEKALDRLERNLDRFFKRTTVVLDVAQITSNRLNLRLSAFNLSQAIRNSIENLLPVANRSGSVLSVQVEENVICFQDDGAVDGIVENLLTNAIKYGAGRPIELSLSTTEDNACLTIRDHGVGIDPKEIDRIFGRFERASRHAHQPGFGLGLWVTRNLLENMGGSISVTSEEGAGSLFTVTFPLNGKKIDE